MSQLAHTPPPALMTAIAASPRPSKLDSSAGHHHHSQVRQLHTGPIPAQQQQKHQHQQQQHQQQQPQQQQQSQFDFPIMHASTVAATRTPEILGGASGYFGFMVEPNDGFGSHSTKNWSPAGSSIRSAAARSPLPVILDNPPQLFQKQTELLAHKLQRASTAGAPKGREYLTAVAPSSRQEGPKPAQTQPEGDYFSAVRSASPVRLATDGETWPPAETGSIPASQGIQSPTILKFPTRSMTLPVAPKEKHPALITPKDLSDLITRFSTNGLLLLDVRTYKSFSESRIKTAVNLCIPTTLLKRPSFNVAKLSETFANNPDKERFGKWKQMKYIIVYDTDSKDASETSALAAIHTLSKFSREGWAGSSFILKGMILFSLGRLIRCLSYEIRRLFYLFDSLSR